MSWHDLRDEMTAIERVVADADLDLVGPWQERLLASLESSADATFDDSFDRSLDGAEGSTQGGPSPEAPVLRLVPTTGHRAGPTSRSRWTSGPRAVLLGAAAVAVLLGSIWAADASGGPMDPGDETAANPLGVAEVGVTDLGSAEQRFASGGVSGRHVDGAPVEPPGGGLPLTGARSLAPPPNDRLVELLVDDLVDAVNAGDIDRAIGHLGPDAVVDWRSRLEFTAGQGARISDVRCGRSQPGARGAAVTCHWLVHDALALATSAPGDRVEGNIIVAADQIISVDLHSEPPDATRATFMAWLNATYPEDAERFTLPPGTTADDAYAYGVRFADTVDEWRDEAAEELISS